MTSVVTPASVGHLLRELAPQVLGALARRHGEFADAEDAVQEALIAAAAQWPVAGVPDNPRGWLFRVAVRRLTDQLRSDEARRRREEAVAGEAALELPFAQPLDMAMNGAMDAGDGDDTLALLFMCCHPALTPQSAIALTLRAVGGLSTAEIARAFMVPEATMAQRISRAKQAVRNSGVPFRLPTPEERRERLGAVLHTLYLIFNEGYASGAGGELRRPDLTAEAIRLTRMAHAMLPDDAEVTGLLALMLLTDARAAARTGAGGELVTLDEQDRGLWDRRQIAEGMQLVEDALRGGRVGYYQLQAAIAALHDEAPTVADTDWPQILALYLLLERIVDAPMVRLNRAIATAMVHGAEAGLELLLQLDGDPRMKGHYRLDAVRGHLYEMAGDVPRAVGHYRAAAGRTASAPERDYLLMRVARLNAGGQTTTTDP